MSQNSAQLDGLVRRFALAPGEIERRSLEIVRSTLGDRFDGEQERFVATRILYASGDTSLADNLHFSSGSVAAGVDALRRGAAIATDVRMVASGISAGGVGSGQPDVYCAIDRADVAARARSADLPRAVEAMRALAPQLDAAIVAIGNAPTALLSLLDLVDAGMSRPALIIGFPVGFVAAAEAKQQLELRSVPFITIRGTRGGSPLAAAAVNALLALAGRHAGAPQRARTAILFAGHGSRAPAAAEAMIAAVDRVRSTGIFPITEIGYLEMVQPDIAAALRRCVEQGANRVLVVPYFLHQGMHIRRDIPQLLRGEAERYPGLRVSLGQPIGLHADLANVMLAGALETENLADIREVPLEALPRRGEPSTSAVQPAPPNHGS
jgi:precorrin-8X/cobalt-precorrin-8 methylmutase